MTDELDRLGKQIDELLVESAGNLYRGEGTEDDIGAIESSAAELFQEFLSVRSLWQKDIGIRLDVVPFLFRTIILQLFSILFTSLLFFTKNAIRTSKARYMIGF